MTVRSIVDSTNSILHQKAKRVIQFDDKFQELVDDLIETMEHANGQGLAAPQIEISLCVAVIHIAEAIFVIVNPKITQRHGEYEPGEGCLSVPGYRGTPTRAMKVTVKAQDRFGKKIRIKASGLLAQTLQHEIDHLDGILYTSRLASPSMLRKKTIEEMINSRPHD